MLGDRMGLIDWCLTPLLCCIVVVSFYKWREPECVEKIIDFGRKTELSAPALYGIQITISVLTCYRSVVGLFKTLCHPGPMISVLRK